MFASINQVAASVPFEPTSEILSDNVQDAIQEAYSKAKGIRTFPFELHYVSGTGSNTTMNNGTFFRVRPVTASSGSFSGYPAAFPLQLPFNCKLFSIVLTFRRADFDWNTSGGIIRFELETRTHTYNGSSILNRVMVRIGNYGAGFPPGWNSSTGDSTFTNEVFFNSDDNVQGFSYISGIPEMVYGDMIGCRFVKAPTGDRRINSFSDIVMKLNYEEVA